MTDPRNLPTWAIVAILTAGSGGLGIAGGAIGSRDARPDPYTGTQAKDDFARIERRIDNLEVVVRTHNADAWEWKAKITDCQRQIEND